MGIPGSLADDILFKSKWKRKMFFVRDWQEEAFGDKWEGENKEPETRRMVSSTVIASDRFRRAQSKRMMMLGDVIAIRFYLGFLV